MSPQPEPASSHAPLAFAPDEVHIGLCRLDDTPRAFGLDCLSVDESARAQRWHFARDRERFIAGRAWLRHVLAGCVGAAPAELVFVTGPHGKPMLARPASPLQFNLSHSSGLALLALTHGRAVGVDLEAVRSMDDCEAIARRNFARAEFACWQALPLERRLQAFFACWTRKEAYVKAIGGGLSVPLASFEVTLDPNAPAALSSIDGSQQAAQRWSMWSPDVAPGFIAAVVAEGEALRLHRFDQA